MLLSTAKYRDVREGGVLEEGNCLGVRKSGMRMLLLQRGEDEVEENADRLRASRPAHRMIRAQKIVSQAACG
jgi:hypothetical protein